MIQSYIRRISTHDDFSDSYYMQCDSYPGLITFIIFINVKKLLTDSHIGKYPV